MEEFIFSVRVSIFPCGDVNSVRNDGLSIQVVFHV